MILCLKNQSDLAHHFLLLDVHNCCSPASSPTHHSASFQIVGDIRVAREALIQITTRLRINLYREKPGGSDFPSAMSGLGLQGSSPSGYGGRREPGSPGGMYSSGPGLGLAGSGRSSSSYQNMSPSTGAWGNQV